MDKTYFEITRQYDMLEKTIKYIEQEKDVLRKFYQQKKPQAIVFVGSGSSYYLAQSAEIISRMRFGVHAFSITSGDAMVNFRSNRKAFENTMAVAISRSGTTTEMVNTLKAMKNELNISTVGITCVEDSTLGSITDLCLKMPWTFDECVCQTGTVTNLYSATALLLAAFTGDVKTFDEMKAMTADGNSFIQKNDPSFKEIAEKQWDKVIVLADGEISGIASEGALAFKEICCTVSNYYHVLDVRHGPMVLADKNTLVIAALKPDNKEYQLDLIKDLSEKGSTIVVCTDDSYDTIKNVALHIKHLNVGNIAEGLPLINTAQLIAYHRAIIKGLDPGNPDGLDAWINLA